VINRKLVEISQFCQRQSQSEQRLLSHLECMHNAIKSDLEALKRNTISDSNPISTLNERSDMGSRRRSRRRGGKRKRDGIQSPKVDVKHEPTGGEYEVDRLVERVLEECEARKRVRVNNPKETAEQRCEGPVHNQWLPVQ
jgi:hypothetical protein